MVDGESTTLAPLEVVIVAPVASVVGKVSDPVGAEPTNDCGSPNASRNETETVSPAGALLKFMTMIPDD